MVTEKTLKLWRKAAPQPEEDGVVAAVKPIKRRMMAPQSCDTVATASGLADLVSENLVPSRRIW